MSKDNTNRGVIWISSYPKSGNTWMRFILANLLSGNIHSSADVDAFIPEAAIFPGYRIRIPDDKTVFLKTHWAMNESLPLIPDTLGFIYMVRNPLDVMASLFHFNRLRLPKGQNKPSQQELKQSQDRYIDAFIRHKGNPLVGHGGGNTSWVSNIEGWINARQRYPHVIIRYEDMLEDTQREIKRVLEFLGENTDDTQINNAIRKNTFKTMKKLEEKEIAAEKPGFFFHPNLKDTYSQGSRFMRKGKPGDGKQILDATQLEKFIDAFGTSMQELGYAINSRTGVVKLEDFKYKNITAMPSKPVLGHANVSFR